MHSIVVNLKVFKRALQLFKPVAGRSLPEPRLRLRSLAGGLELWSADSHRLGLFLDLPVPGGEAGGEVTVSYPKLLGLAKAFPGSEAGLALYPDRLELIPEGSERILLPALSPLEAAYPDWRESAGLALPGKDFAQALAYVLPYVQSSHRRGFVREGLEYLKLESAPGGGVDLVATDACRLAWRHLPAAKGLIPDGPGFLGFSAGEAKLLIQLAAEAEQVHIDCGLLDGGRRADRVAGRGWCLHLGHECLSWPNWRHIMPDPGAYGRSLVLPAEPLRQAIRELEPLLDESGSGVALHPATASQTAVTGYIFHCADGVWRERELHRIGLPAVRNDLACPLRLKPRHLAGLCQSAGEVLTLRVPDDFRGNKPLYLEAEGGAVLVMPEVDPARREAA